MYLGGFLLGLLSIIILKTAVTLLAIWLVWRVHQGKRALPKARLMSLAKEEYSTAGSFLFWGLGAFLLSEVTCGVEIYILLGPSPVLRLVHAYSSALGAGLLVYGVAMALDRRSLHYFDHGRPCVLMPVCRECLLRAGGACKFHPAFAWGLCLMVVMAVPLLFVPVRALVADPSLVALPFTSLNAFFDHKVVPALERYIPRWKHDNMCFVIPREMTLAEFRHIPMASLILGLSALVMSFVKKREKLAFLLACCAAGPLMYAYLEAAVYALIPEVYVGQLGHEAAEILGLAALRSLLYELLGSGQ